MSAALDIPVTFDPSPEPSRTLQVPAGRARVLLSLTLHLEAPLGWGTALDAIQRTSELIDQARRSLRALGISSRREPLCFVGVQLPSERGASPPLLPPAPPRGGSGV